MSQLTVYNTWLYIEFGVGDKFNAHECSDSWPFKLVPVGEVQLGGEPAKVFQFSARGLKWYLVHGKSLSVYQACNLTPKHFKRFLVGNHWLGINEPVDLNTSVLGDPAVPGTQLRKKHIQKLAQKYLPKSDLTIPEGILLKKSQEYVALVTEQHTGASHVVSNNVILKNVPYRNLNPWKRLSLGIGTLIATNKLDVADGTE